MAWSLITTSSALVPSRPIKIHQRFEFVTETLVLWSRKKSFQIFPYHFQFRFDDRIEKEHELIRRSEQHAIS